MSTHATDPLAELETQTSATLEESTERGAKRIFTRFILVAVGISTLVGLAVVVYNVADHLAETREMLREVGEMHGRLAMRLRRSSAASDREVLQRVAALLKTPMALLSKDGVVRHATDEAIPRVIASVYHQQQPKIGTNLQIREDLNHLSGSWGISKFSDRHNILIIVGRLPSDEGIAMYMTIGAGITGMGIALSFFIMLIAANWMLRRPLGNLVNRLTGALALDVQRRKEAEERAVAAQKEAEEHLSFLNNLIDASESVGIVAINAEGSIQLFNWAAVRILGYNASEVIGKMGLDQFHLRADADRQEDSPLVHPREGEELWVDRQGNEHLLAIDRSEIRGRSGTRGGLLLTFIDLTEQRQLEAELQLNELQLIQSAKLATLGEMATGMAHEINQPLNNIGLLASRMSRKLKHEDLGESLSFYMDKLKKVEGQVQRAGQIIDHLRAFGRPTAKKVSRLEVRRPVEEVMIFLREQLIKRGIEVEIDIPDDLPRVEADEARLEQVLMNLIINARDALLETGDEGRRHEIRLAAFVAPLKDGSPGVTLEVRDNGPGMSREVINRIFEPFFSTKEVGKGTGLGLSISYGLVREFGGVLEVESRPGAGTTFSICLRQAAGPSDPKLEESA